MKISITEKPENAGEISELREQVLSLLTSDELFAPNKQELCYHSLKQFDFQNLDKNDKSSIEDACNQIVKLIGMESDALIELGISDEPRLHEPMNRYMHYFLGLDMVPGIEKQRLLSLVQQDLDRINSIITDYETNYQFIADEENPRNHNQRTIYDFYNRCIAEKDKIEEYLNNGLEERVKEKAGLSIGSIWGFTRAMMSEFLDRPYEIHFPRSNQFFKHDDINQVSHRIGPLPIKDAAELRKLYNTDKEEFYKELETKLSTDKIFTYLINSIKWLPLINPDRIKAFGLPSPQSQKHKCKGILTPFGRPCIYPSKHLVVKIPCKLFSCFCSVVQSAVHPQLLCHPKPL